MQKMTHWMLAVILTICGAVYTQAETLRGTVKDAITGEPLIGATVKIAELENAAAYKQSVLQKRSAGSLMAGAMYYYGHIDYASNMNADLVYLMHGLGKIKLWQGSVGVGYAYNWVPARGWIVNVMAMPMLTFVNRIKAYGYATNVPELLEDPRLLDEEMTDDEWDEWWEGSLRLTPMGETTFNGGVTVNFDARLSLSYNFGRYFLNVFGQFNNNRYRHNASKGYLNDWFVNTSIGVRL